MGIGITITNDNAVSCCAYPLVGNRWLIEDDTGDIHGKFIRPEALACIVALLGISLDEADRALSPSDRVAKAGV